MKHLGPALVLLILGICGYVRLQDPAQGNPPLLRGGVDCVIGSSEGAATVREVPSRSREHPMESLAESPRIEVTAAPPVAPGLPAEVDIKDLLDHLRSSLDLTEEQSPAVAAALLDRARDLQFAHAAIRKSGVFSPGEYGRDLSRMKDAWFRNVDAVLDSSQHLRFRELVKEGCFRPGTEVLVDLNEIIVLR